MEEENNKVKQLAELIHVTELEAKNYLEAANGDIDGAIGIYYESFQSPPFNPTPSEPPPPHNHPHPVASPPVSAQKPPSQGQPSKPTPSQPKGIMGLSDIRKPDVEDEKRDQFYAGGEKSGIAVLDPTKQNRDQLVDQVFQSAQKHGAVPKHEEPVTDKEKFGGTGYTLGNTTAEPSKVVAPKPKPPGLKRVILTFYTDCFTIDDGPPRKFQDPANADFLNDVHKGVVPRELEALAQGDDLNIELLKKNEEYKPPAKPKVVAFSGSGHALGEYNAVPVASKAAASLIVIDESKPITSIQVRLADGTRLTIKCNHHHTIGDIKGHLEATKPSGKAMELRLSYPNKILSDESQSVQDAGLLNASIVQRLF